MQGSGSFLRAYSAIILLLLVLLFKLVTPSRRKEKVALIY